MIPYNFTTFRIGHTWINPALIGRDRVPLVNEFFSPEIIHRNGSDDLLKNLFMTRCPDTDRWHHSAFYIYCIKSKSTPVLTVIVFWLFDSVLFGKLSLTVNSLTESTPFKSWVLEVGGKHTQARAHARTQTDREREEERWQLFNWLTELSYIICLRVCYRLLEEVITEDLFRDGTEALDLAALNVQRGRDHGVNYVRTRQALGLVVPETFQEAADLGIFPVETASLLASCYEWVDLCNVWDPFLPIT